MVGGDKLSDADKLSDSDKLSTTVAESDRRIMVIYLFFRPRSYLFLLIWFSISVAPTSLSSPDLLIAPLIKLYSTMEAINSQNLYNIRVVIIFQLVPEIGSILRVFRNFNFHKEPGLLQFWACSTDLDSEDIGCNLVLTDLTCNPTQDQGLEDYREICLENQYPFIGIETNVGNWSAGRAAQTGIADQRTTHHVLVQEDQHSEDVGTRGQLVLPVFYNEGAQIKPVGIIEYVTPVPKECYVADFEQFHNLLEDEGLKTTFMGKTIKVVYNGDIIRFTLPLSAKFTDLQWEVTKRLTQLQHQIFRVEYNNTEGIRLLISSDIDLWICMAESSSRGAKLIRMFVFVEHSA